MKERLKTFSNYVIVALLVAVFVASFALNAVVIYKQLIGNEFDAGYNTCMKQWMYKNNKMQVPKGGE